MRIPGFVVAISVLLPGAAAFATPHASTIATATGPTAAIRRASGSQRRLLDPAMAVDLLSSAWMGAQDALSVPGATATAGDALGGVGVGSHLLTAFTDQGQNLAGIFFQASLLPYLLFLYFLSFKANRLPETANFGFQYLLLFVLSTIPSGIITKAVYGTSLANVDWLHGGAESLLTVANVLVVLGLKQALTSTEPPAPETVSTSRNLAFATAGLFAVACALGTRLGVGVHSPFLFGLGDLPSDLAITLPWVQHSEPANALSIPTWAIHFSSIYEYLFAMGLVWDFAQATENPKWKGLTWGMLPLHASGVCACTYHFFYNAPELQFLVTSQAGLTLLGNITCMLAAFRIARSNGWTLKSLNPFPASATSPEGLVAEGIAAMPLVVDPAKARVTASNEVLAAQLAALTLASSYLVKYGELGLDLPFAPNALAAGAMITGIPALTALRYYKLSDRDGEWNPLGFLSQGGGAGAPALSMADVKKYGVAGTVAYVLTELAFWVVAFPVAAAALYQSTGHWPDVVNETADRAAVLGFIFAGANIARLMVPLRLGAALALAPWVDANILSGKNAEETTAQQ